MHYEPELNKLTTSCKKPSCERTFLHRHHVRNESLWIALAPVLAYRPKWMGWSAELLLEMQKRYKEFRPEDVVHICSWHHAEIHLLYDLEIEKNQRAKKYKPLAAYTYKQARRLSDEFEKVFNVWIKKITPGADPALLQGFRAFPLGPKEVKR
jgi:hypothetical protein